MDKKKVDEEVASNVSANLGGPLSNNATNISGLDLPMKIKDILKRRVGGAMAGYAYSDYSPGSGSVDGGGGGE